MTKRVLIVALAGVIGFGLILSAAGTLSGSAEFGIVTSSTDWFEDMNLELVVNYDLQGISFTSESLIVYPGTWVWQAFGAEGQFGAYGLSTSILFGASTADYLYAEMIIAIPVAGIDFAFHGAQLSSVVVGGPQEGWAVSVAGSAGPFDLISITEFGAEIEDEDNSGITIIHAPSGQTRHYVTDPRVTGAGFTGQKIKIENVTFCCADLIQAEIYFTCAGLDYIGFGVSGLKSGLSWLILDTDLTFALDEKTMTLTPGLVLGDIACFDIYAELKAGAEGTLVDGITIYGIELLCELGPVTVREVAIFDLTKHVITAETFGSKVALLADAIADGYDFYPNYWQLLSIEYIGDGCCGSPLSVLVNTYFSEASTYLFDVAMVHAEASIPLSESFTFSLAAEFELQANWALAFGFYVMW